MRDLVERTTLADGFYNADIIASIQPEDISLDTRDVQILQCTPEHSIKHTKARFILAWGSTS